MKYLIALLFLAFGTPALAQSSCGFVSGQVLTAAQLNACSQSKQDYSPALGLTAPYNLVPNSQWESMGSSGSGAKENIEGTGTMPAIAFSANTTGSNTVVLTVTTTGELKVGDLIKITGSGVDAALTVSPERVTAISPNASITFVCPQGLAPSGSHTGVATPWNAGMAGSSGTGDAADGNWKKTPTLVIWREDNAANVLAGAYYAMGSVKDLNATEDIFWQGPNRNPKGGTDAVRFRGRTVSFGVWGYQKVQGGAGTWSAFIQTDGTGGTVTASPSASSGSGYQWLEVSIVVPVDATVIYAGWQEQGVVGDAYYMADPVFAVAQKIGSNGYTKPRETLLLTTAISPVGWINRQIVFPSSSGPLGYEFVFDVYAETSGAIAPTVMQTNGQIEGYNDAAPIVDSGVVHSLAFFSSDTAPEVSGTIMSQVGLAGAKVFPNMVLPFDGTGHNVVTSNISADTWKNVSMEIDYLTLQ